MTLSVTTIFEQFMATRGKRRYNTLRNDRSFPRFCLAAGVKYVCDLDYKAMQRYEINRAGYANSTIRNEIKVAKTVLNWGVRTGLISKNPIVDYRTESANEDVNPHRAFTLGELQAIIAAAQAPVDLMVKLYVLTGMRKTELCSLRWSDVDLDRGVINLSGHVTKTRASRFCVLGSQAVALLRRHIRALGGGALVFPTSSGKSRYCTIWNSFRRTCSRAGIDTLGAHIHSLRVTCATLLYMQLGATSAVVDMILGHGQVKDPRAPLSIRKYLKPDPETIRPWIEKLEGLVLS